MPQSGVRVSALGVEVAIEFDNTVSLDEARAFERLWDPADGRHPDRLARLTAGILTDLPGAQPDVSGSEFRSLASNLSTRVTLAAIEERKGELLMLHACGVASPTGEVVAFVGPSGRGKTTLASVAARAWSYVTDETVGITPDGTVLPYRKPLSVIEPGSERWVKTQLSATELGLLPLPDAPLAIAAIVLIERDSETHRHPEISRVPLVEALVGLVPEISYLPALDKPIQHLAALLTRLGGAQKVTYSEAADLPPLLPDLISAEPALLGEEWSEIALSTTETDPPSVDGRVGRQFYRVPALDGIAVGSAFVLLHDQIVHVLEGIGPEIWSLLDRPLSLDALVEGVVAAVGQPAGGDATELVAAAVKDLMSSGVIAQAKSASIPER